MKQFKKWAVVYRKTGEIFKTFEHHGEALYCVTDCFGPEYMQVTVIELKSTLEKTPLWTYII